MNDDVVGAVAALIGAQWGRDGKAILLSNLPAMLNKTVDLKTALRGKKLSARLREADAAEVVKVVQSPRFSLMWGIVPAHAEIDDLNSVFPSAANASSQAESVAKIRPAIRLAFTRPLAEGMERHLLLDGHPRFQDVLADEAVPEGSRPISRESLCDPDSSDDEVVEKFSQWAQQHAVDSSKYLGQLMVASPSKGQSRAGGNALERFLAALTNEERRRVVLPADIVAKFL
jgi:hypothetical protein